ncbi:DNA polymerase III subunit epsilon [Pontibacillus chungwhensis BH030062]|uniref:DNA polymerase III subunit epsilon n=1 Tax=Pontibacillus chungwhensis BH030062 TaxID=1385513 RepID=A0A0A2UQK4_9BACI|nr:exonuclease domain-containing protein [Pontibacillus chungwhensis]KGP90577.1 DNA polymerase III subunit epsilon [Pontibacillus chungwhensis BH030062]
MNFIALDFETANSSRSSVCSIGLVEYENGQPKREYYSLVKPRRNYFAPINISVHGITKEDVEEAHEFDALWHEDIQPLLEGKFLLAHNAQFDMGVLRAVLDEYNIPYPMIAYNCTMNISKKTWSFPRYNLKELSHHLNIDLNHHHALDDARAAAQIFLDAGKHLEARDEKEVVDKSQTINGMMFDASYEPARLNRKKRASKRGQKAEAKQYMAASHDFNTSHPFYNATFVFTGRLKALKRDEAIQRVVDLGGDWETSVQSTTNYVVVGNQAYENYLKGKKSSKLERVETLIAQGHSVEVLSEDEFIRQLETA